MANCLDDVAPAASLTRIVKENGPAAVRTPVIRPVPGLSVRPAGSEPELIDQEYGGLPPAACIVTEYAAPAVPPGSVDEVSIDRVWPWPIGMANCFVALRPEASLA